MYAIIRTGGKQYKVQPGDVIRVEKLENELGSEFDLTDVLMVGGESPVVGEPTVKNAKVTVVVTKQTKDRKVIIFKKKRRQGYRRLRGHRQLFTELFVKAISLDGKTAKTDNEAKVVDVDQKRQQQIAQRSEKSNAKREISAGETLEKVASKTAARRPAAPKKKSSAAKKRAGAMKSKKKAAPRKTTKKA
jgi:large subunit ribosomal protein L21